MLIIQAVLNRSIMMTITLRLADIVKCLSKMLTPMDKYT